MKKIQKYNVAVLIFPLTLLMSLYASAQQDNSISEPSILKKRPSNEQDNAHKNARLNLAHNNPSIMQYELNQKLYLAMTSSTSSGSIINDEYVFQHFHPSSSVIKSLLEQGANPNIRYQKGSILYNVLDSHQGLKLAKLLVEYGADIHSPTPLSEQNIWEYAIVLAQAPSYPNQEKISDSLLYLATLYFYGNPTNDDKEYLEKHLNKAALKKLYELTPEMYNELCNEPEEKIAMAQEDIQSRKRETKDKKQIEQTIKLNLLQQAIQNQDMSLLYNNAESLGNLYEEINKNSDMQAKFKQLIQLPHADKIILNLIEFDNLNPNIALYFPSESSMWTIQNVEKLLHYKINYSALLRDMIRYDKAIIVKDLIAKHTKLFQQNAFILFEVLNNIEMLKLLIDHGGDINVTKTVTLQSGEYPFTYNIMHAPYSDKISLLDIACCDNNVEAVQLLLKHGARLNLDKITLKKLQEPEYQAISDLIQQEKTKRWMHLILCDQFSY